MKFINVILIVILFFLCKLCSAQIKSNSTTDILEIIGKDVGRWLIVNPTLEGCYFHQTILKISINRKSKVREISFADNTEEWLKKELQDLNAKGKIRTTQIDSIARKEKIKSTELLIPFVVQLWDYPCKESQARFRITNDTYSFDGQLLKGNVIFCKEISLILYTPPIR